MYLDFILLSYFIQICAVYCYFECGRIKLNLCVSRWSWNNRDTILRCTIIWSCCKGLECIRVAIVSYCVITVTRRGWGYNCHTICIFALAYDDKCFLSNTFTLDISSISIIVVKVKIIPPNF